ncbi:hypothetical protein OK074_3078 [Actinobacteria bacterium OK074]|nr:hypothetical protein OK074_3078 [Actinobacteria bacterium OK074]
MTSNNTTAAGEILIDDEQPTTGTPIIELRGTGKAYGNVHALHGVGLSVKAGQVTCVLGDNGAGKSTLIKIISGLHQHPRATSSWTANRSTSPARVRHSTRASPPSTRTSPRSP